MKEIIHSHKYLKSKRRTLRNNSTAAETVLWKAIRNKQLRDRKFTRQHSIRNYIVDFYCPAEGLIIELDGRQHNQPGAKLRDWIRDEELGKLGFTVLRFENKVVFQNLEGVLDIIVSKFGNGKHRDL